MSKKYFEDINSIVQTYETCLPVYTKSALMGTTLKIHDDFQKHINMLERRIMEIGGKDKEKVLKAVRDVFKEYLE